MDRTIALISSQQSVVIRLRSLLEVTFGRNIDEYPDLKMSGGRTQKYDLLIMWVPERGLKAKEYHQIKTTVLQVPVLAVCDGGDLINIKRLIKYGVTGLVKYDQSLNEFIKAARQTINKNHFICQYILKSLIGEIIKKNSLKILSEREMDILRKISEGKTYMEVSNDLYISFFTTKTHLYNIYRKLQVNNKSEAVYKARKNRIIN